MGRGGASGGFAVFAELLAGEGLAPVELGTGIEPAHPGRRLVRINGSPAAAASLGDWLAILWLTPAMDRLFVETAGNRRRFLARLVLALDPRPAPHGNRSQAALLPPGKLPSHHPGPRPARTGDLEAHIAAQVSATPRPPQPD